MFLFRKVKNNSISFFQIITETLLISEIPHLGTPALGKERQRKAWIYSPCRASLSSPDENSREMNSCPPEKITVVGNRLSLLEGPSFHMMISTSPLLLD